MDRLEEIKQELAQISKEEEKIERQRKVLQSEINTNIRKARNRLLIRLGGDWLKLTKLVIDNNTDFERAHEILKALIDKTYNSLPRCSECGNPLLKLSDGDYHCRCGAVFKFQLSKK